MSDDKNQTGSVDTGSPADKALGEASVDANAIKPAPATSGESGTKDKESETNLDNYVAKLDYEELQKKLGENSEELGSLRKFFEEINPLMKKLQDEPEVIEAIMAGKLNKDLAQQVLEGKVKLDDATDVVQAHAEVKEEVGDKKFEKLSSSEVEKLIVKKLEETINPVIERLGTSEKNFNKALTEADERREFENDVNTFVKNTPDFQEYAEEIDLWFAENPDQYKIDVAYYAVKGEKITTEAVEKAKVEAAEEAKNIASNAGGGQSQGGAVTVDENYVDSLFGKTRNPNS